MRRRRSLQHAVLLLSPKSKLLALHVKIPVLLHVKLSPSLTSSKRHINLFDLSKFFLKGMLLILISYVLEKYGDLRHPLTIKSSNVVQ